MLDDSRFIHRYNNRCWNICMPHNNTWICKTCFSHIVKYTVRFPGSTMQVRCFDAFNLLDCHITDTQSARSEFLATHSKLFKVYCGRQRTWRRATGTGRVRRFWSRLIMLRICMGQDKGYKLFEQDWLTRPSNSLGYGESTHSLGNLPCTR